MNHFYRGRKLSRAAVQFLEQEANINGTMRQNFTKYINNQIVQTIIEDLKTETNDAPILKKNREFAAFLDMKVVSFYPNDLASVSCELVLGSTSECTVCSGHEFTNLNR